jgi:Uma2 family endonuclease
LCTVCDLDAIVVDMDSLAALDPRQGYRLPVSRYHKMIDAGLFDEDDKIELVEGVLVEMSPQEPPHAAVIDYLTVLLARALAPDLYRIRAQLPLTLARSEPEPDLAVTDRRRRWQRHPETALLVVEVAGSSLRFDRDIKAPIYAEASVEEYWIVEVERQSVHVFTQPDVAARAYGSMQTMRPGDRLRPASLPGIEIAVSALFDPDAIP